MQEYEETMGTQADDRLKALEEENKRLREREGKRVVEQDLNAIRQKYPDCGIARVEDLGEDFLRLRAGGVDALKAYRALKGEETPSAGSVQSGGGSPAGMLTREEVRRMTPQEVKENYDRIRRSMENWR